MTATFFISLNQACEPCFGKRGLYPTVSQNQRKPLVKAYMWVMNYSDGEHSLEWISERSGHPIDLLKEAARDLINANLLKEKLCEKD